MANKKQIDPNLLIAIGVLIASCAGLFIYYKQAAIMGEQTKILLDQTKATAWPQLSIKVSRGFKENRIESYSLIIENGGMGPAIIQSTELTYNEKIMHTWKEFYEELIVPDSIDRYHTNNDIYDRIIQANEKYMLVDWTDNKDLMRLIYQNAEKIEIKICYKSVYNDFYSVERKGLKTNLEKNIRQDVDSCLIDVEYQFQE